jgi:hypothetical protein
VTPRVRRRKNCFEYGQIVGLLVPTCLVCSRHYSHLHQNIQDAFNEAGIEIMSPHYSSLRDGNMTTIPESYLPKEYRQPGFRVDR